MKAVFLDFDTLGPGDIDAGPLRGVLPGIELRPDTAPDDVARVIADAAIVVVNKVVLGPTIIAGASGLRLVCLAATGTDNVALEAARARGIAVANIRDYCAPSVTQHVFALVLALTQRLREYDALLASGAWEQSASFCLLDLPYRELAGKTLGIVGLGNLGRAVAGVAAAFGMRVLAARRPYRAGFAGSACGTAPGVQRVALAELLQRADVVSLHCPLNEETRSLVDAGALAQMRADALLINTARGALVDPEALVAALRAGRLGGAGIDVLEREPPGRGHPLLEARLANLIVTPHVAWAAREARQRALEEIARNVASFLQGARRNRVD